jgi:hypothetical protein
MSFEWPRSSLNVARPFSIDTFPAMRPSWIFGTVIPCERKGSPPGITSFALPSPTTASTSARLTDPLACDTMFLGAVTSALRSTSPSIGSPIACPIVGSSRSDTPDASTTTTASSGTDLNFPATLPPATLPFHDVSAKPRKSGYRLKWMTGSSIE